MSGVPVAHMVVRPSTKLLIPHYVLSGLVFVAGIVVYLQYPQYRNVAYAMLIIAILWDVVTMFKHMKRRFVCLTLDGDRLRYEEGMLSKSTRSLNLAKVQDVRVEQSVMGRMLRVGSLTLETAGETGRLTMENIDSPQQVADHILALARRATV